LGHPYVVKSLWVIGVIVGGLVASSIAAAVTRWMVRKTGLETLAEKAGVAKILYSIGAKRGIARFLGKVVWLCGLVVTLAIIAEMLGLPGIAAATGAIVAFAPKAFAGGAIIVAGIFIGDVLRNVVSRISRGTGDPQSPNIMATVVYYAVMTLSIIMAIDQIGIKTALIDALVRLAFGGILLALAIGFGFGSRAIFQNLLARQYYEPLIRLGDSIELDGKTGVVVRFSRVALVIRYADGQECIVPCKALMEQNLPVTRLSSPSAAEKDA
jgi:small-conductance mechanosensitive channel